MFLGRSWELAKACFHVLKRDKEILLLPLIAAAVIFITLLVFVASIFVSPMSFFMLLFSLPIVIFVFAFLGVFFEAAVIGCATIRLEGGDPKIRDGLKIAAKNWWPLLQWALIGIIVGIILGAIRGMFRRRPTVTGGSPFRPPGFPPIRSSSLSGGNLGSRPYRSNETRGFAGPGLGIPGPEWGLGDILAGVLGMAWAVATFFVIPIMIYEKLSPLKAVRRSWEIVKNVWKETLILKLGFGAVFGLLGLLGLLAIFAGVMAGVTFLPEPIETEWRGGTLTTNIIVTNAPALITGFVVAISYWVALGCVSFAAKGVLRAVLHKYSKKIQVKPVSGKVLGEKEEVICTHCGAKIPEPSAFCPHCGARLAVKPIVELPTEEENEFNPLNNFIRSLL